MISAIRYLYQKILNYGAEDLHVESQVISRKRSADEVDVDIYTNSPKKHKCVNEPVFSTQYVHKKVFSSNIPSSDSCLRKMAESKKPEIDITLNKGKICRNSDLIQCKGAGLTRSSQNPIHGKENNVIEISDDEFQESEDVQYICGPTHIKNHGSTRTSAVPKHNHNHQSRHSTSEDNMRKVRNLARDLPPDRYGKRGCVTGTPNMSSSRNTTSPKGYRSTTKVKKIKKLPLLGLPRPESSFRLVEKINFAQLLKQYRSEEFLTHCKEPSTSKQNHLSGWFRYDEDNDVHASNVCGAQNIPIEVIDLTKTNKFDKASGVRRDLEAKPETLASKMADAEIRAVHKPKPQTSHSNTLEQHFKSHICYGDNYIQDTLKKYDEKKLDTQRDLQEPLIRVKCYGRQNSKDNMKIIEEGVRRHMKITEAEIPDVLEEPEPQMPSLTSRMQKAIDAALKPSPPGDILVQGFSLCLCRRDMQTLANLNWLNDEVINFYMNLLIERGKSEKYPNVYAFSTFFYPKLLSGGHSALKRWTRKIDIFSYKLIIVPVHMGVHWCMAAVNFEDKTIRYYDSMGSSNNNCLRALRKYLEEESLDKKKVAYDMTSWSMENVKDIPQQMNGSDCGVFACMYSEYICRQAKFTFTQDTMPYFRRKMVYELLNAKLLE